MTDFYCDHGAYASVLGTTPTWGVPQEGDGSAKDAATASSVAEIRIIASPTAAETLVIAGAVITAGASAAANVFVRGATPADTATNIVALINSANATNVVSVSVARAIGNLSNQVRNLFYAQVKSGATDTVQIMFRVGSAALNHAANSFVAISASGWASAPTITQFIGGSGGCFGWFTNLSALGQGSSLAVYTYGVFSSHPAICYGGAGVSTYVPTIEDPINVRNNGLTISKSATVGTGMGRTTNSGNLWLRVDSNLIWTGDNPAAVFTYRLDVAATSMSASIALGVTGTSLRLEAHRRGGLVVALGGSVGAGSSFAAIGWGGTNAPTNITLKNIKLLHDHTQDVGDFFTGIFAASGLAGNFCTAVTFLGCDVVYSAPFAVSSTLKTLRCGNNAYNGECVVKMLDTNFSFNWTGAAAPTIGLLSPSGNTQGNVSLEIVGGSISGWAAGWPLVTPGNYPLINLSVQGMRGVDLGSAIAGLQTAQVASFTRPHRSYTNLSSPSVQREFRYEATSGVADWIDNQHYPTLNARLPNGDPWSMRVLWMAGANINTISRGFSAPPLTKQYRDSDAIRDITLRFWVKSALVLSDVNFTAVISYVDTSGAAQSETVSGGSAITTADAWDDTSSYSSGYVAKSVSLTTAVAIKSGTEVGVVVVVFGPPSTGSNEAIFVDPEFGIA